MKQEELNKRLDAHQIWWETGAETGNLTLLEADLERLDFNNRNLRGANFSKCNVKYATFENANLTSINVVNSDFRGCNFKNAILNHCDFRYVKIDEHTNFEGVQANGLVIDKGTLDLLPQNIKEQNIALSTTVEFIFQFNSKLDRDFSNQVLNDLSDYLREQNPGTKIDISQQDGRFRYIVEPNSMDDVAKIRRDIEYFGEILRGETTMPNQREQQLLEMRYKILEDSYNRQLELTNTINTLFSGSREELVQLRQEKKQLINLLETMGQSITMQNRALPEAMSKQRFNIADENKDISVKPDDILYLATTGSGRLATLAVLENGGSKQYSIRCNSFEEIEKTLSEKNPDLFQCNKGVIINMKYVKSYESVNNNRIKVYLDNCDAEDLFVGVRYAPDFRNRMERK
jgi:uncharacterized protein YjbI with pentapeptide repeats